MLNGSLGPIEKGANDGQAAYAEDLLKGLRSAISSRSRANTSGSKVKKSRKRKNGDSSSKSAKSASPSQAKTADWGLFEPLHGILGPIADIFGPLISVYTMGILALVLAVLYWRSIRTSRSSLGPYSIGGSPRLAAYEELWRTEEAALWDWLEDRVGGSEGLAVPLGGRSVNEGNADMSKVAKKARDAALKGAVGGVAEKEVRRAIEATEEKLRLLREGLGKGMGKGKGDEGNEIERQREKESAGQAKEVKEEL